MVELKQVISQKDTADASSLKHVSHQVVLQVGHDLLFAWQFQDLVLLRGKDAQHQVVHGLFADHEVEVHDFAGKLQRRDVHADGEIERREVCHWRNLSEDEHTPFEKKAS